MPVTTMRRGGLLGVWLFLAVMAPPIAAQFPGAAPIVIPTRAPSPEAISAAWRDAASDTVKLLALVDSTLLYAANGARALAHIVTDTSFRPIARLYALWGLEPFLHRWLLCQSVFPYNGNESYCGEDVGYFSSGLRRTTLGSIALVSIDPGLRDTIRAMIAGVRDEPGGVGFAVASALPRLRYTERWNDSLRRVCLADGAALPIARTIFDSLRPGPLSWANGNRIPDFGLCNESAPPLIAEAWEHIASDVASLTHLANWSIALRDQRVLDAVLATAQSAAAPITTRIAAIHTLGALLHQGVANSILAYLAESDITRPLVCKSPGNVTGFGQENGAIPITDPAAAKALAALVDLGRSRAPAAVAAEAAATAACVRSISAQMP